MRQNEVRYGFELAEDVTIPSGSELRFVGGKISGAHTLTGSNSRIVSPAVVIFDTDVTFAGTWNIDTSYPEWFDVSDAAKARNAIQKAIDIADHVVLVGDYDVQNSVYDPNEDIYTQRQLVIGGTITEDYITIGTGKNIEIQGKVKATSPLTDLFRIVGDNVRIYGGGIIEGCGVVNDYNDGQAGGEAWKQWEASLIRISGSNNKIEDVRIYNPTTNAIYILQNSYNTNINTCQIGGGLASHGTGTVLMGVFNIGLNTVIENNRFIPYDGKSLYTALYVVDQTSPIRCIFRGNYVEGCLEHVVYSYADGCIIENNYCKNDTGPFLQMFCRGTKVIGNKFELTEDILYDGSTLKECGGICLEYDNNIIKDNTFINFTKYAILIDTHRAIPGVNVENNIIENNRIDFYYGFTPPSPLAPYCYPINVSSEVADIKNITIKNNHIFGKNVSAQYSYTGAITMIANGETGGTNKVSGVKIEGNYIENIPQNVIYMPVGTRADNVYDNVSILHNTFKNVCNHANVSELPIKIKKAEVVIIKDNYIEYDSNAVKQGGFVQLENVDMSVIESNTCISSNDAINRMLVIDDLNKASIKDNYLNAPTRGLFKIASGSYETAAITAAITYNNIDPKAEVRITPLNDAAIELQASANYVYQTNAGASSWYGWVKFQTKNSYQVPSDCLFEWELVYTGSM